MKILKQDLENILQEELKDLLEEQSAVLRDLSDIQPTQVAPAEYQPVSGAKIGREKWKSKTKKRRWEKEQERLRRLEKEKRIEQKAKERAEIQRMHRLQLRQCALGIGCGPEEQAKAKEFIKKYKAHGLETGLGLDPLPGKITPPPPPTKAEKAAAKAAKAAAKAAKAAETQQAVVKSLGLEEEVVQEDAAAERAKRAAEIARQRAEPAAKRLERDLLEPEPEKTDAAKKLAAKKAAAVRRAAAAELKRAGQPARPELDEPDPRALEDPKQHAAAVERETGRKMKGLYTFGEPGRPEAPATAMQVSGMKKPGDMGSMTVLAKLKKRLANTLTPGQELTMKGINAELEKRRTRQLRANRNDRLKVKQLKAASKWSFMTDEEKETYKLVQSTLSASAEKAKKPEEKVTKSEPSRDELRSEAFKNLQAFDKAINKFLYTLEKFDREGDVGFGEPGEGKRWTDKEQKLASDVGTKAAALEKEREAERERLKKGGAQLQEGAPVAGFRPKGSAKVAEYENQIKQLKADRDAANKKWQQIAAGQIEGSVEDIVALKQKIEKREEQIKNVQFLRVKQKIADGEIAITPEFRKKYPALAQSAETQREEDLEKLSQKASPLQAETKEKYDELLVIKKTFEESLQALIDKIAEKYAVGSTEEDKEENRSAFLNNVDTVEKQIDYLETTETERGLNEQSAREQYFQDRKVRRQAARDAARREKAGQARAAGAKAKASEINKGDWKKMFDRVSSIWKSIQDKIFDYEKYDFLTAGAAGGGTSEEATAEIEAVTGTEGIFGAAAGEPVASDTPTKKAAAVAKRKEKKKKKGVFSTSKNGNKFLSYMTPPYSFEKFEGKVAAELGKLKTLGSQCGIPLDGEGNPTGSVCDEKNSGLERGKYREVARAHGRALRRYKIYFTRQKKYSDIWGEAGYGHYLGTPTTVLKILKKPQTKNNIKILRRLLKQKTRSSKLRPGRNYQWLTGEKFYNQLEGGEMLAGDAGAEEVVSAEAAAVEGSYKTPDLQDLEAVKDPQNYVARRSVVNFYEDLSDPENPKFKYGMPEGKKDRLGKRLGFEEGDLNKLAKEFFGYENWSAYKKDNANDLRGPTKRGDEAKRWSGIKGPTLHPMHVGFAAQEFLKSINPEEYIAVLFTKFENSDPSLKPGAVTNVLRRALATSEIRNKIFGGAEAAEGIDKTGILAYAMYEPREGLVNKEVITKLINVFLKPGIEQKEFGNIQVVNTNNLPIKKVPTGEGKSIFKVSDEGEPLTLNKLIEDIAKAGGDISIKKNNFGIPVILEGAALKGGAVFIVPKNLDQKMTNSEDVLAKRIGAKIP